METIDQFTLPLTMTVRSNARVRWWRFLTAPLPKWSWRSYSGSLATGSSSTPSAKCGQVRAALTRCATSGATLTP
jgi:hypothetical protein